MYPTCDLHTHSIYSDGTCSPSELLKLAESAGLSAIALCDHNTVDGLPEFIKAGASSPVEAVPGIEFSTEFEDLDVHILALFVSSAHYCTINQLLCEGKRAKERSNLALVDALGKAGYVVNYEKIRMSAPSGHINRCHIAAALTEKGYTASIQEAFSTLLSPKGPYYTPPARPSSFDMISFIHSIGAVSVLAHPLLTMDEKTLRRFLDTAAPLGLHAMETMYPSYSSESARLAEEIARTYSLKYSGGSDFHGRNRPDIAIGTGKGNLQIPLEYLEALKKYAKYPGN